MYTEKEIKIIKDVSFDLMDDGYTCRIVKSGRGCIIFIGCCYSVKKDEYSIEKFYKKYKNEINIINNISLAGEEFDVVEIIIKSDTKGIIENE